MRTSTIPVVLGVGAFLSDPALSQDPAQKSLYERLGGYETDFVVVNDNLLEDIRIKCIC